MIIPTLTEKHKQQLRKLAHALRPVVMVGDAGLSENVLKEIEGALVFHELIKIKLRAKDRAARAQLITSLLEITTAQTVQSIGHVLVIYRPGPKNKIQLV